jgi:hypothetical protein
MTIPWLLTVGLVVLFALVALWSSGRAPRPRTFRRPRGRRGDRAGEAR